MVKKREGKEIKIRYKKEIKKISRSGVLKTFLDTIEIGAPISYKNLTIFPVFRPQKKRVEKLKTLSEALSAGIVEIKETGVVREIEIINKSDDTKILILEGETIKGGAQNRVINTTVILDEKASVKVPTTCVQQHRWNGFDAPFTKTDYSPPSLLCDLNTSVYKSMMSSKKSMDNYIDDVGLDEIRRGGRSDEPIPLCYNANQSMIWNTTAGYLSEAGSNDLTGDLHSAYKEKKIDIDDAYNKIKPYLPSEKDWVGIVSIINAEWILLDVCDEQDIAKHHLERLIRSHIYEALVSKESVESSKTTDDIVAELTKLSEKKYDEFDSLTKNGKELRYQKNNENISILFYKDDIIHILFSRKK